MKASVNNKYKAFTSLEQSRKLAEILPVESADMRYISFRYRDDTIEWIPQLGTPSKYDIPCWSPASLLSVLPEGARLLKSANISSVGDTKYHCDCPKGNIDGWFDNPVDACYEMILKLNEQNLL